MKTVGTTDDHLRTEARLIAALRAAHEPLGTAELADRLGLHPNGVRVQLRRLERRGLIHGQAIGGAVGRPRVLWHLRPRAIAEGDLPHTGWALARTLAMAIPPTPARLRDVEQAGRRMGRELADDVLVPTTHSADPVEGALAALGFDPERAGEAPVVRYVLRACPYADAVRENPAVVCTLHRGAVRGLLDALGTGAELTRFAPRLPAMTGCVVEITGASDAS